MTCHHARRTDSVAIDRSDPRPRREAAALLTAEEERELAAAIARGDKAAKDRMILANHGLVARIAREYLGRGLAMEDLIGEGTLGLIRATEEYDPAFNTRFSTYAAYWIRQAIRHALINTTATIRLPAHMIGLLTKCRRADRSLRRERGCAPSAAEVASRLGLSRMQQSLVAKARNAGALRLESSFAGESSIWAARAADDSQGAPSAAIEAEDDARELRAGLVRLDERERFILAHRFGLGGGQPLTLKEIGRRLGLAREWVRKLEIRALRKPRRDGAGRAGRGYSQPAQAPGPARGPGRSTLGVRRR